MIYPIKYFCGSGAQIYPQEVFNRNVEDFINTHKMPEFLVGETGIDGLLIDFNFGLRLQIPEGNWHVRIVDAESGYVFFEEDISAVTLVSLEKYYVEWEIAIWLDGEPVFFHQFDPRGQNVHFYFRYSALGDTLALLPYVEAFRKKFRCNVTCLLASAFYDIVRKYYPHIRLMPTTPRDSYAGYFMFTPFGIPFGAISHATRIPLLDVGHSILRCISRPPKTIFTATKPRKIKQKYVCIAVQASTMNKSWLNPDGWDHVIDYLKSLGYRVLCIDRDRRCSGYGLTIEMPSGAEDFSGKYDLIDRVNQLAYADFFIGASSGLAWLAWSVDIPVIMISGITEPWYEFDTPYRVNNPLVCHGCFNAVPIPEACYECPLFKGTDRAFECSKEISARQVINVIERLIADHNLEARHGNL